MIGRNWLTELHLEWRAVNAISLSHSFEGILEQNKETFQQGLRKIKGLEANLHLDTQAKPLYFNSPFTLARQHDSVQHGSVWMKNTACLHRSPGTKSSSVFGKRV